MKKIFIIFLLLSLFSCKSIKKTTSTDVSNQSTETSTSSVKTDLDQKNVIDSMMSGKLSQSSEFTEEEETVTETYTVISVSENETKKVPVKITTSKKVSYKIDNSFEGDAKYYENTDTKLKSEEDKQSAETSQSETTINTETELKGFDFIKSIIDGIFPMWSRIAAIVITLLIPLIIKIRRDRKKNKKNI
jgi:uncharacterized membrane protein YfhO